MTAYRARDVGPAVRAALAEMPVVVLTGLRQAGKSTFLQREPGLAGRRFVSLDDFAQLQAAQQAPDALVRGSDPLSIDEAQRFPELLLAIKREVDRDRRPGRFLLSGSANFALLRDVADSLAGRAVYLILHPFTRRELRGQIDDEPFLKRFFASGQMPGRTRSRAISADDVLRGGMPPVCLDQVRDRSLWFRGYEQTYLERDVRDLTRVTDLVTFRLFLQLAVLRTGQVLKQSELARDAKLNAATAGRYLSLMEASFVLNRLPPFLGSRSTRLIKSPKLYAGDSGLACHLAGVNRLGPQDDEPLRGPLFETYVAQNLLGLLSARWPEARPHFFGVQGRHEVDFVLEVGRDCLAIEVKATERWDAHDLRGLRAFLAQVRRCRAGILAYNGTEVVSLGDRLWALPLDLLLS